MQLITYLPPQNVAGLHLVEGLRALDGMVERFTFENMTSLVAHLRRPLGTSSICILVPADNPELSRLVAIRHLLRDMRIVLILPDGNAETVSEGHFLRPRYVTYADDPVSDITQVVRKMIGRVQRPGMAPGMVPGMV